MTTKQLILFGASVVVLTLVLAWLIERRAVLSLRAQLDGWGAEEPAPLEPDERPREGSDPVVGWPDDEPPEAPA